MEPTYSNVGNPPNFQSPSQTEESPRQRARLLCTTPLRMQVEGACLEHHVPLSLNYFNQS